MKTWFNWNLIIFELIYKKIEKIIVFANIFTLGRNTYQMHRQSFKKYF